MNTLDRYIARHFLGNIIVLLILLFSFVVTIDVALNIDRFLSTASRRRAEAVREVDLAIQKAASDVQAAADPVIAEHIRSIDLPALDIKRLAAQRLSESSVARATLVAYLVGDLWWPRLLQLFSFLMGMVLVGAMGFTLAQLVRHRELVAMLAGGISLRRIARPILLVAALLAAIQVLDQEFIIPRIAPLLTRDHGEAGHHEIRQYAVPLTSDGKRPDGSDRLFFARTFDPAAATLKGVHIWDRDPAGRALTHYAAPNAKWTGEGWRLAEPVIEPLLLTPAGGSGGAPGIPQPVPPELLIKTELGPEALNLRHFGSFKQSLSLAQLTSMLHNPALQPEQRAGLQRIRYGRVSMLISAFLSLLISMPFFLMREPRNMVWQSLKSAPVGIGSLLGGVLGAAAPIPGIPPGMAVFLPVLILMPVAIAAMVSLKT